MDRPPASLQALFAPLDPIGQVESSSSLRGWVVAATGGRLSPMSCAIGHVLPWPSALDDIKRFVAQVYQDIEGQRSLCLQWGEMESAVPTYAALGLPGAFTVWFVDARSLEALVDHGSEARAPTAADPARSRADDEAGGLSKLAPVLAALPGNVPGFTFELEADSVDRVARSLAMEVVALERVGISHARCLVMMLRSSLSDTLPPRNSDTCCASASSSSDRTRTNSRGPGSEPASAGGL